MNISEQVKKETHSCRICRPFFQDMLYNKRISGVFIKRIDNITNNRNMLNAIYVTHINEH
jgi:predicted ATPase with chaperone activity